jgi:hypothetical protein
LSNEQEVTKVLDITPNSILLLEQKGKDRTTKLLPANTFNTLKYVIKGSFEGMLGQSHNRIWLGDNCVISPTTQEYVFCLEYDGNLVHTTPDADKLVCEAILKAYSEKDFVPFIKLFNGLYQKRLRNEFIELFMMALGARIRPTTISGLPGYIVDNEYFVAQNGNAHRIDQRTGEIKRFLCIVPKNHQIKPMNLTHNGVQVVLGQQEQIFLSKIMMLLNRERHKKDGVFWRQVAEKEEETDVR